MLFSAVTVFPLSHSAPAVESSAVRLVWRIWCHSDALQWSLRSAMTSEISGRKEEKGALHQCDGAKQPLASGLSEEAR